MSQATSEVLTPAASTSVLAQESASPLPADYVETDPAQCGQAKIAHLLGIFGILGTGLFYILKRKEAGRFVQTQMKEAFNFHALVFVTAIALSVCGAIAGSILGLLGLLFSLASFALWVGALLLSVMNAMKAGKGQMARYPARIRVLK